MGAALLPRMAAKRMSIVDWLRERDSLLSRVTAAETRVLELREQLDDAGESYSYLSNRSGDFEAQVKKMTIMRDPATVDAAALRIAQEIEDVFVRGSPGGRPQRLAQVQIAIIGAVQDALKGERDYNLGWRKT